MTANWLTVVNIAIGVAVLLVSLGRWGGKLESRRNGRNPMSTSPSDAAGTNGTPSLGELSRRVADLELEFREDRRNYLPREEANARWESNQREHEDLWGAVKDLRVIDSAAARRIDGLMGSGN